MTDEQITAPGPTGAPTEPERQRPPLTRSERHRVVAGVCGGLGRHLDIDPVVFRVVVAVLCLSGGLGLFLYGLAWLIVPREPVADRPGRTELQRVLTGRVDGQSIGAVLLTLIGTGVFFSSMGDGGQLFPILLLGGLILLAVRYDPERRRRSRLGRHFHRRDDLPGGPYDRPTDGSGHPYDLGGAPADWRDQAAAQHARERSAGTVPADTPAPGPSGYLWDPRHPERNPYGASSPQAPQPPLAPQAPRAPHQAQPWWQRPDLPEGDPLRKGAPSAPLPPLPPATATVVRHRQRSFLAPAGLLLAAGAGALAWWLTRGQGDAAPLSTVLAAALLGLGVAILIGARYGRARRLAVPALLLTIALGAVSGTDATLEGSVGDRLWAPVAVAEVQADYRLGAGDATLDLSAIDPAGGTVTTTAKLGAGDLKVSVPGDVEVRLTLHSGLGSLRVGDRTLSSGVNNRVEYQLHPTNGQPSKGTLDLDLTVGLGDLKVEQS
ncbi:PspC domain-containing protein [Kitasatospora sp. NPDC002040]|uniref:PspC domain-containing protein n=1 Tax=Kitasatospora sp. NPDC002040 TaxID=3154661 RepID=UPI00332D92C8